MESNKRIRANIRLEIETRAREIEDLEEDIKKEPTPEKEEKLKELREYYEKLKKHYESLSGMDLETASKLKVINISRVKSGSWFKKITLSISAFLMAGGFYNMMIQGLEGYELNEVIIDLSSGFLAPNFTSLINKMVLEPAIFLVMGFLIGGSILNFAGTLIPKSTTFEVVEAVILGVIGATLSYSLVGFYLEILEISDVEWIFHTMAPVIGILFVLCGLVVLVTALKSTSEINDFKVLGFIEAIFILAAGSAYLYGYFSGGENLLYQWPNTYLLMFSAFFVRGIRMLLKKEQT